jgi:hypothetical protein
MQMPQLNDATKRDIETIKAATADFVKDIQSPWFWIGLAIVVFFIVAPFVLNREDLPW